MTAVNTWDWGTWILGDMSDAIQRTAELLGRSAEVVAIGAAPPNEVGSLPRVAVTVPHEGAVFQVHHALVNGEYPVRFTRQDPDQLHAEVGGLDLLVIVDTERVL